MAVFVVSILIYIHDQVSKYNKSSTRLLTHLISFLEKRNLFYNFSFLPSLTNYFELLVESTITGSQTNPSFPHGLPLIIFLDLTTKWLKF